MIGLDFIERRLEISAGPRGPARAASGSGRTQAGALRNSRKDAGADLAIVATADSRAVSAAQDLVRRGGRVLLFANTVPGEVIPVDVSRICVEEKQLIGSYSSSVELQERRPT